LAFEKRLPFFSFALGFCLVFKERFFNVAYQKQLLYYIKSLSDCQQLFLIQLVAISRSNSYIISGFIKSVNPFLWFKSSLVRSDIEYLITQAFIGQ